MVSELSMEERGTWRKRPCLPLRFQRLGMTAVPLWLIVMTVTLQKLVRNRGALALLHLRPWTETSEKSFEKEEEPQ